jgi:hypothetical protein
MDKALFYHIADVIQEHRSWIEVTDTHDTIDWSYPLNGEFHHIRYQVITLHNFRNRYCWQKPHVWKVNEHDLADAVRRLIEHDRSAKQRVDALSLTCKDVEYIIQKATHEILKLELYEFEY